MRNRSLLIAIAAFGAGVLLGHVATRTRVEHARAHADEAAPSGRLPPANVVGPESGAADDRMPAPEPSWPVASPDADQSLDPGTDFGAGSGEEFALWYAVHRRAWDLPDLEEVELVKRGDLVVALGRIPRREVLLVVLGAFRELDCALQPIAEESAAWHAANPYPPRDHPTVRAFEERLRNEHQRCFDRLHRELAYSDYLLLLGRAEGDVEKRPPPGGRLPGGDPYACPIADAREFHRFFQWYRAYGAQLRLPERDEDFLGSFHQHVVLPLGRLPQPPLMRALQDAYSPVLPQLRQGADWDASVRVFFARLDGVLAPLDYERVRYSPEWKRTCKALSIPGPTER